MTTAGNIWNEGWASMAYKRIPGLMHLPDDVRDIDWLDEPEHSCGSVNRKAWPRKPSQQTSPRPSLSKLERRQSKTAAKPHPRGIPGTGRRKRKPTPDPERDRTIRVIRFDHFGKRIQAENR